MTTNITRTVRLIIFLSLLLSGKILYAEGYILEGRVYSRATMDPVDMASVVIIEAQAKARTGKDGGYRITVPEAGEYTVIVRSDGLKSLELKITISKNTKRDFPLSPLSVQGAELTITGKRDVQKVSRRTMTAEQLKKTPASLGDAINALSSLPGVDRTDGNFFGPLVIRSVYPYANRYYIDGLPINSPYHFMGLHSVIYNNLISEIDLYSSAFPNQYGGAIGAIININTIDSVTEFGGYTDIGILSTAYLFQMPLTRSVVKDGETVKENSGYIIASGRYSYWSLALPRIIKWITDETIEMLPQYYDYQVKAKYYINKNHSLKLLFIGSNDTWNFIAKSEDIGNSGDETTQNLLMHEDEDPMFTGEFEIDLENDDMFNNLGLYYIFEKSLLKNTLMTYASLTRHHIYVNMENENIPEWMKDLKFDNKPYIYGIKNDFSINWSKFAVLRGNVEYTFFNFIVDGKTFYINRTEENFNILDDDAVAVVPYHLDFKNHQLGGYVDNKFTYKGLTFIPGMRFDYLKKSDQYSVDYRGMLSYEFESTGTTLMASGGKYSSHFQVNPYLFKEYSEASGFDYGIPEKAYHSVFGIEQVFGLFTASIEAYFNYYFDLLVQYTHYEDNKVRLIQNSGNIRTKGIELMLRKDMLKGSNGIYGWMSYTYCTAQEKSGITGNLYFLNEETGTLYEVPDIPYDPEGNNWQTSDYERLHSLKLVSGIIHKAHELGVRFQLTSSFPYTNIVGGRENPEGSGRYEPVYNDRINTEHLPVSHRLDIRYSYKKSYKWGYLTWYVELIDVYGYWMKTRVPDVWSYTRPYERGSNPRDIEQKGVIPFIPNFGVEVKF